MNGIDVAYILWHSLTAAAFVVAVVCAVAWISLWLDGWEERQDAARRNHARRVR